MTHDPARIYLDTAAVGIPPAGMGAAVAACYDVAMSRGIAGRDAWLAKGDQARRRLAELLDVPFRSVELFGNTTHAMNLAAASLRWREGDEIVIAADEHASVRLAWGAAQRAGARIVEVRASDEAHRTALLVDALGPRSRAIAVSHVHPATGTRIDLEALRERCDRLSTLLFVDGVQAVGAIPVNARQADVYCGASFKWLRSGFGLGFMSLSDAARDQIEPAFRGYRNLPPSRSLQYSHWNYPALHALDHGLDVMEHRGWTAVHAGIKEAALRIGDILAAAGFQVVTPARAMAGIVSIHIDPAARLQSALQAQGIDAAAKETLLRFSPAQSLTPDELVRLERVVGALRRAQ